MTSHTLHCATARTSFFFRLFNSNTTCCCLETKNFLISLHCSRLLNNCLHSNSINNDWNLLISRHLHSEGSFTIDVTLLLWKPQSCCFLFLSTTQLQQQEQHEFFSLTFKVTLTHCSGCTHNYNTQKKTSPSHFLSRCCSNYLRIHSCCCRHIYNGNNSTRSPNHLKKTWDTVLTGVAHKWCHTMTHFFTTTTTTWSCNFFHTDLIIWSYIRHYFNHLNNY